MINNNSMLANTYTYTRNEMSDDLDEENSINQDEDLNQIVQGYDEKQLVIPQPEQASASDIPKTEADLIGEIRYLNMKMNLSSMLIYWQMGKKISSFYQGEYGTGELKRIAEQTGVGQDSLTKACKFAKQYSEEQLQIFVHGNFQLSWFQIAQNLSVEPQKLIDVYQEVRNPSEFHNAIMKLKDPVERRGKAKKAENKSPQVDDAKEPAESPETEDLYEIGEDVFYEDVRPPLDGDVFNEMAELEDPGPGPDYESYRQELETMRAEKTKLKGKIEEMQADYDQLSSERDEGLQRVEKLKNIGAKYQSILRKIYDRIADGMTAEELFDELQADALEPFLTGRIFKE